MVVPQIQILESQVLSAHELVSLSLRVAGWRAALASQPRVTPGRDSSVVRFQVWAEVAAHTMQDHTVCYRLDSGASELRWDGVECEPAARGVSLGMWSSISESELH